MRTMAVTAGLGHKFRPWALRVKERWERVNPGIPCVVLLDETIGALRGALRSALWIEAFIWDYVPADVERVIWIDADVVPWAPLGDVPEAPFSAAPQMKAPNDFYLSRYPLLNLFKDHRFNAGVFVCTRASLKVFAHMKRMMTSGPDLGPIPDEDCINLMVLAELGGFEELPVEWNWFRRHGEPHAGVKIVHPAGTPRGMDKGRELADLYARAP